MRRIPRAMPARISSVSDQRGAVRCVSSNLRYFIVPPSINGGKIPNTICDVKRYLRRSVRGLVIPSAMGLRF